MGINKFGQIGKLKEEKIEEYPCRCLARCTEENFGMQY